MHSFGKKTFLHVANKGIFIREITFEFLFLACSNQFNLVKIHQRTGKLILIGKLNSVLSILETFRDVWFYFQQRMTKEIFWKFNHKWNHQKLLCVYTFVTCILNIKSRRADLEFHPTIHWKWFHRIFVWMTISELLIQSSNHN